MQFAVVIARNSDGNYEEIINLSNVVRISPNIKLHSTTNGWRLKVVPGSVLHFSDGKSLPLVTDITVFSKVLDLTLSDPDDV